MMLNAFKKCFRKSLDQQSQRVIACGLLFFFPYDLLKRPKKNSMSGCDHAKAGFMCGNVLMSERLDIYA
jgi:hypothetical protein